MSMNLKSVMTRTLEDEYETQQLVPVESNDDGRKKIVEPSQEQIEELTDDLPASAELQMRTAILEAIADAIVEDAVEESAEEGKYPDTQEIEDEVEDVVEAAETFHLIPHFPRQRIRGMIVNHMRRADPLAELAARAAHFCAGTMSEITKEDDLTAGQVLTNGEEIKGEIVEDTDAGIIHDSEIMTPPDPISQDAVEAEPGEPVERDMRYFRRMSPSYFRTRMGVPEGEDDPNDIMGGDEVKEVTRQPEVIHDDLVDSIDDAISDEVVQMTPGEPSDAVVTADPVLPKDVSACVRYLAASTINHRKATAIMSNRISGVLLMDTLYKLRYRLPKRFLKKYNLYFD